MVIKYALAILLTVLAGPCALAQNFDISVQMGIPEPNALHWDDIWNVSIDNNIAITGMPTTVDIKVELTSDELVYEAVTEKFIVPLGATYLNAQIAKTKSLNILVSNAAHQDFFARYNTMKDGTYQLCVTLNFYSTVGTILYTTSECIFHEVSHPGIILLNTPINGDTVLSEMLQFNWTHVTEGVDLQPSYVLDLVPLLPNQSPETAIAMNRKRLSIDGLQDLYLDYPQIERPLDTGMTYTWRVIAYTDRLSTTTNQAGFEVIGSKASGRQELARSEVGYFVCGESKSPTRTTLNAPRTDYYIDLEQWTESQTYFFTSFLPLSVKNPFAKRNMTFRIFNDQRELIEASGTTLSMKPGLNQVRIDLSSEVFVADRFYFAELYLADDLQYTLRLYKSSGL